MPAFNFQQQFGQAILDGSKRLTIRAPRVDGRVWSLGAPCALYTGMRTKACRLLGRSELQRVERVRISAVTWWIGDRVILPESDLGEAFAIQDGHADPEALMRWFLRDRDVFRGVLYGWGSLRSKSVEEAHPGRGA